MKNEIVFQLERAAVELTLIDIIVLHFIALITLTKFTLSVCEPKFLLFSSGKIKSGASRLSHLVRTKR